MVSIDRLVFRRSIFIDCLRRLIRLAFWSLVSSPNDRNNGILVPVYKLAYVCVGGQVKPRRTQSMNQNQSITIDPMQKGVSLFLSYTNMNKMNSLHHVKEHPKISHFLQFESYCFHVLHLACLSSYNSSRSPSATLKLYRNTNLDRVFWMIPVFSP